MADIRKIVYSSLLACAENGKYANIEADTAIERNNLADRDKAFYTALFYGVTEKQITLDYQIKKLSKTPIEKLQTKVLVLLRMGFYQILFMDSIPDHAAVNETVALAKQTVNQGACGYINGMLRSAIKELKNKGQINLFTPSKEKDICGYLSITYSYPRFLCKLWVNAYGIDIAEKIMHAQNSRSVTTIRINTLKTTRNAYLEKLIALEYKAKASDMTDDGIHIEGNAPITSLPDFENGFFFVQDDASRLCVEALSPQNGETVLDTCACPGGKTFASAMRMKNTGKIVSCDLHENKLSLITRGAKRLGIEIIEARQVDGSLFNPDFEGKFDKVLCDVPCSGFGTISKKPDLRLKTAESLNELPEIQLAIVNNCAKYLKSGGTLVYSTCTLNPEENENNVKHFLENNPDFSVISETTHFPHEGVCDGFYYAKMIKN